MRPRIPVQIDLRYKLSSSLTTALDLRDRGALSTRLGTAGLNFHDHLWSIVWDCIFEMGYRPYNKT